MEEQGIEIQMEGKWRAACQGADPPWARHFAPQGNIYDVRIDYLVEGLMCEIDLLLDHAQLGAPRPVRNKSDQRPRPTRDRLPLGTVKDAAAPQ